VKDEQLEFRFVTYFDNDAMSFFSHVTIKNIGTTTVRTLACEYIIVKGSCVVVSPCALLFCLLLSCALLPSLVPHFYFFFAHSPLSPLHLSISTPAQSYER
jgi:hypothetical protein